MNIKSEKGITLLALVVTIVVMIILASITISASVGDNGLIKQTQTATIKASIREVEEALDTKILLTEKDNIKNGDLDDLTVQDLIGGGIVSISTDDENQLVNGKYYNIYKINISELDIEGDYGKGDSTTDVFKVEVELTGENGSETKNYKVFYIDKDGTRHDR